MPSIGRRRENSNRVPGKAVLEPSPIPWHRCCVSGRAAAPRPIYLSWRAPRGPAAARRNALLCRRAPRRPRALRRAGGPRRPLLLPLAAPVLRYRVHGWHGRGLPDNRAPRRPKWLGGRRHRREHARFRDLRLLVPRPCQRAHPHRRLQALRHRLRDAPAGRVGRPDGGGAARFGHPAQRHHLHPLPPPLRRLHRLGLLQDPRRGPAVLHLGLLGQRPPEPHQRPAGQLQQARLFRAHGRRHPLRDRAQRRAAAAGHPRGAGDPRRHAGPAQRLHPRARDPDGPRVGRFRAHRRGHRSICKGAEVVPRPLLRHGRPHRTLHRRRLRPRRVLHLRLGHQVLHQLPRDHRPRRLHLHHHPGVPRGVHPPPVRPEPDQAAHQEPRAHLVRARGVDTGGGQRRARDPAVRDLVRHGKHHKSLPLGIYRLDRGVDAPDDARRLPRAAVGGQEERGPGEGGERGGAGDQVGSWGQGDGSGVTYVLRVVCHVL